MSLPKKSIHQEIFESSVLDIQNGKIQQLRELLKLEPSLLLKAIYESQLEHLLEVKKAHHN